MGARTCPFGIVSCEPVAELDVCRAGEKSCIEEEDYVRLPGFKIDVRAGDTVGYGRVIRECPTGYDGRGTQSAGFFCDVGSVNESLRRSEPESAIG